MTEGREAKLRGGFSEWYPTLKVDWWYPACQLADLVLEQRRSGEPQWELESRVPSDAHFLFRGGRPRRDALARTQCNDRIPGTPEQSEHVPGPET